MEAKCGNIRVHHWAHRGERNCDPWWERETEWHRAWKMNFPNDWQEVIQYAPSGEKHIADIRTPQGVTIEFQHSHLTSDERKARETFYREMIWVVDGLRLVRDLPRFKDNASRLRPSTLNGVFSHPLPKELFPSSWLGCTAPVYIDFGVAQTDDPHAIERF